MKISLNRQIGLGVGIGLALGFMILFLIGPESDTGKGLLYFCNLTGKIFINALKMILIPLVFTSITVGIANLKAHAQMNRVWKTALGYFLMTTSFSILLGLVVINVFKPGVGLDTALFQNEMTASPIRELTVPQHVENFLSQLFINPFAAMANGDVLSTVIFAILLGIALVLLGQKAKVILSLFKEFFDIIMIMVGWIMRIAPFGIGALVAKLVATQNVDLFGKLAFFILIVIGATLFHGLVTLPCILKGVARISPIKFFGAMRTAFITAFSTSSSAATLPVTMRCVEDNLKVDKNVAGFVLPLGATINMDGTALYEAVAAIFVANLVGMELTFVHQLTIFFMAMIASIGAPGIPSAGMVTMAMVLKSVGLPIEAIGILLPIDRLLDAIRTTVNVEGDAIGSCVVHRYCKIPGRLKGNS